MAVDRETAQKLVEASAWWLTHCSGNPVRAPKHSKRVFHDSHWGWSIEFGANVFLIEYAINGCLKELESSSFYFMTTEKKQKMEKLIRSSVTNVNGDKYEQYPLDGRDMVFGATSIDIDDCINFIFNDIDRRTGQLKW